MRACSPLLPGGDASRLIQLSGLSGALVIRASLISAAGFGVTLLDCDSVVSHPFLGLMHQLEANYSLIILPEGPANGGTWHLRASPDSGAALWIIRQIGARCV